MGSAPTGVGCPSALDLEEASREDDAMKSVVSSPGEHYDAPHLAKNAANYTALTPHGIAKRCDVELHRTVKERGRLCPVVGYRR